MRVLFLTEGGRNIGFGHVTRCMALAEGIREWMDKQAAITFVVDGDDSVKGVVKRQNLDVTIENWIKKYGPVESKVEKSDLLIIDSYLAPKSLYDRVGDICSSKSYPGPDFRLIMIDDYNRIEYPPGIVINPSIYGDRLDYSRSRDTVYLLGKDYVILRKEFWDVPEKVINREVKDILIAFGGMDNSSLLQRVARHLNSRVDVKIRLVDPGKKRLEAKEMLDVMLKADICISGGGQTTYELARVGVPAIGIYFAENQRMNLECWHERGVVEYIGRYMGEDLLSKLESAVDKFMRYEERLLRSRLGKASVDGKGVKRIIDRIMKSGGGVPAGTITLRRAEQNDCYDVWNWRNHAEIRKWSFNKSPISYEEHKAWFEKILKQKKTAFYIAENQKNRKVGQARLEINGTGRAHISVNMNPDFLGKGYGSDIIKTASLSFMKENPEVREVTAEIIDDNTVSRKAFAKAGYAFSHRSFREGVPVAVFTFRCIT